jgi:protein-tyrosine phosphatase
MPSRLSWLSQAWPGRVALAARPRGGDWLNDEVAEWKRAGIGMALSLLEHHEEESLDLRGEAAEVRRQGIEFTSFPIPDRQVPASEAKLAQALDKVEHALLGSKNVLVHCRQGVGRTGLIAVCLLMKKGMSPGAAVEQVSVARGVAVPETDEQREWIDHYAAALMK